MKIKRVKRQNTLLILRPIDELRKVATRTQTYAHAHLTRYVSKLWKKCMICCSGCREYTYIDTYLYLYTLFLFFPLYLACHVLFVVSCPPPPGRNTYISWWLFEETFTSWAHAVFAFFSCPRTFYKNKNARTKLQLFLSPLAPRQH